MAIVVTPDGRQIYVPDGIAPQQGAPFGGIPSNAPWARAPMSGLPGSADYSDPFGTAGQSYNDEESHGREKGVPYYDSDMNHWVNPVSGQIVFPEGEPRPVAGPRTDAARIGQGVGGGNEVPGLVAPSVTGGVLPSSEPATFAGQAPVSKPDYTLGTVDNTDAAVNRSNKAYTARRAAEAKAAARQAAFDASPEGQARAAARGAQAAVAAQAQAGKATADIEAAQAAEDLKASDESQQRLDAIRQQQEQQAKEREAGTKELQQKLGAARQAELDYKIDPNRRWKNAGTAKHIVAGIAIMLSAIGDSLSTRNGTNLALQMIQDAVDKDIDAQKAEREQLGKQSSYARDSLDSYMKETGNLEDAVRMKRSEEYERLAQEIKRAGLRHNGERAKANADLAAAQLQEHAAALLNQSADSAWNRQYQAAQLANQRQNTAIAGGHLALARKQEAFNEDTTRKQLDLEAAKLENAGKGAEAEIVRKQGIPGLPSATIDPQTGQPVTQTGGVLRNKDGSIFVAPTEKEAQDLRAKMVQTQRVMQVIDEIREIRDRVGGESSWGNSPDYQRLQVLKQQLVVMRKKGEQGFSSDSDMERIEKMLGVSDPASFRSQAAGLDEGREQSIKNINTELHGLGYGGDDLDFPDPLKNRPPETPEDRAFKSTLKAGGDVGGLPGTVLGAVGEAERGGARGAVEFARTGATEAQRNAIDGMLNRAITDGSPAVRDAMLVKLQQGATSAETPQLRAYYQSALQRYADQGGLQNAPLTDDQGRVIKPKRRPVASGGE